jgi:hypothetical protein
MRLTNRASSGLGILLALAATACGGGGGGTDAATPRDTNATTDDAGPTPSILPAPTQALGTTPADFACRGSATAPTPGDMIPVTMSLLSFGQDGDHAPDVRVCFCADNVLSPEAIAGTGCGACQDGTSSTTGEVSFMARAGGWYAYRVFAHMGPTSRTTFLDSAQVNETAPMTAGGTIDGNAVSALTANTIPAAELISRTPGSTTIAGRVLDCDGPIRGAIIRAFHADGSEIPEGVNVGDSHYRFFNGTESPDSNATFTAGDGLYITANVIAASAGEVIRVETWANVDGVDAQIGCEAISIFPNGISIVNVGPMRSDYPAGHPCE